MQDKQITNRSISLLHLLFLFLCTWTCLGKVEGQARINGPTCVVAGSTYTYNYIATGTSGTYSITNGVNSANGSSTGSYSGSSFSINIHWNTGITSGSTSFQGTGGTPTASLSVNTGGTLVTGSISNPSQTLNYNTIPATINCAAPTGGTCTGSYNYQWQQSTNNVSFTDISGATGQNLSFSTGLTQTMYYRNFESVSGGSSGYSNTATVTVYPQLVAGNVSPSSTTSNYNSGPGQLSLSGVSGGAGSYTYQWQSSPDNASWTNVSGATASTYTPTGLTATIYYRAGVSSNGVTAYSGSGLVTVYPPLVAGSVSPSSQTLNYNTASAQLNVSGVSGGNGSYAYQWQSSPNNSTWTTISGATANSYSPGNLTATTYYQLVVTSNGASVTSGAVTVTVYPQLLAGSISPASQNINYNTVPAGLSVSGVSGGNGSYSYQWQSSTDNSTWTSISGATATTYTPASLTSPANYYHVLVSSNGATATSPSALVTVYPLLQPGSVSPLSEQFDYGGGTNGSLTLSGVSGGTGSYSYQWQSSTDNITFTNISGATGTVYSQQSILYYTNTYYRVNVTSGSSSAYSGTAVVHVYPQLLSGSIVPSTQTINYNSAGAVLSSSGVSGGIGTYSYQWQSSPDNATWSNITGATASTFSPGSLTSTTYYQVTVISDITGLNSSSATITVYPQLQPGSVAPSTQSINYGSNASQLSISGVSGGSGSYSYQWQSSTDNSTWTSISGATATTYTPASQTSPSNYYHVLVSSNGATATSPSALVTVYPLLQPGSVSPSAQTINYNTNASAMTVSGVSGGNGTYSYQWQSSPDNSSWASISSATTNTYTPVSLTSTTYYNVAVTSNGVTAYSSSATVNVNPQLMAGTITPSGTTVASGTSPGILTSTPATGGGCGGSYTYQWQSSPDGTTWTNITGVLGLSYSPGNLSSTVYYRVQATCGTNIVYSGAAQVSIGTINSNLNYIRVRDLTKPGVADTVTADLIGSIQDVHQTTQYFDGLGRPVQTVVKQASPLLKDMVTFQVYDPLGREVVKYLPYTSPSNDGNFKTDPLSEQSNFNTSQFPGEQFYYGRTVFEASPLNRPLTSFSPGNSWVGSNRGVSGQYLVNGLADSVRVWTINATPGSIPVTTALFPAGSLYKNVTADEAGHQVVEYKDQQGKVILKKVQLALTPGTAHVGWLNTYYVYDDLDNLRFVLQPRAVELINTTAINWVISQSIADELCFRYEYDYRKRMIIKKVPGAGEAWMVYDSRDRLVLSQNGQLRAINQWLFTKYDSQNRPVMTGLYTNATYTSQSAMQAYLVAQNMGLYETYTPGGSPLYTLANSFPAVTDETTVRSYTYYDDYSWGNAYGTAYVSKDNSYDSQFPAASNTSYPYPQPLTQNKQTRGMVTGSVNKKINNNSGPIAAIYYDDRGRLIQQAAYNFSMGVDVTTTQYSFSGQPLQTVLRHQKNGINPQTHTVTTTMSYEASGRLSTISKAITSVVGGQTITKPAQALVTNTYNELGQLQKKNLGSIDNVVYDYNIRGWVTGINKSYLNSPTGNYFGMQLAYDNGNSAAPGTYYSGLQYNGNIAGTIWKSAGDGVARKYAFTYDNVNRLTGADFNQDNGSSFDKSAKIDFSVSGLSYDANGNIGSMKQVGFKVGGSGTIDSLIYSYLNNGASNKLLRVVDSADDQNSKLGDFHYNPTTKGTTDYIYDGNGSLMVDNNKGINYMSYNYLNLPQSIPVNGKGNISYIYDAAGNKLVKTTVDSTSTPVKTTITTYMAGFVYVNDTLQFMGEEESRARWAFHKYTNGTTGYGFEHDFFEKDHLGNTRVLLTQQKDTAQYVATMEGAYRATENALFYNIPATNYPRASAPGYPVDYSVTNPNDSVARVNGSGPKVGPAIILKVMSGDKVDIGANYYYNASTATNGQSLSASDIINSLAAGIVSMTGGVHGSLADLTGGSSPLPAGLSSFISSKDVTTAGKPNAYLNWILLDDQFNYVSSYPQSGALQVGPSGTATGGGLQTPLGYKGISITKSGYLYIYVSNATPSWDVFFDNLSVTTYSGPMLEETHYYPFGLTMAGISDKTLKTQYAENKYRFNDGTELQNKEFSDGSGLELYETDYRGYDPQIGRLWQIDPLGDINESYSPYSFSNDNPILLNDPLGLANDTTTLPTVTVTHPFNPLPSTPTAVTTGLADTQGGAPDVSGSVGSAPTSTADPINSGSSGETAATTDKRTLFEKFDQNETLGNILDAINSFNPLAKGVDLGSTIFTGHDHRGVQQSVGQATLNFAVTIPAGRLSGTITNVAANIGLAEVRQGIAKTFTVANDMAHILASKHNLSLLLPMAGSEANIIRRLYLSLGQSGSLPASGVFERVVNIYGHDVTIRGAVVNGIPRISTAFIP